jgi:hypothetical protein
MNRRFDLMRTSRRSAAFLLALSLCTAAACSHPDDDEVGAARLAITQVPTDTRCIRITVTGSRQVTRAFTVTPGASATFTLGQLPLGNATFLGEAFPAVCSGVVAASVPGWVSDAVQAVVTVSPPVEVVLQMRRNGRGSVSVDFVDDPAGGAPPGGDTSPFAAAFSSSADVDLWLAGNSTVQKVWDPNDGDPAPGSLAFGLVGPLAGSFTISRILTTGVDLSGKTVRARVRLDRGPSVTVALTVLASTASGAPSQGIRSDFVTLSPGVWTTVSLVVNSPAEATPTFDAGDVFALLVTLTRSTADDVQGHLDTVVVE